MFVSEFMNAIDNIDTSNISNQESLEETVQEYATISESFWYKYSKSINTKLNAYCSSKSIVDCKDFKGFIKETKRSFFNNKIQEIALKNKRPWDLMNWVKKCKIPAIEALQFNGHLCIELEIFGKHFIKHSILLKIVKSIHVYLTKFL